MSNTRGTHDPSGERFSVDESTGLLDRRPDPTLLSLLLFLGIPGVLIPSLEWMTIFFAFGLFGLWPLVRPFLPSFGTDEEPTDWITMGMHSRLPFVLSVIYTQFNPFVLFQGLAQLAGQVPTLVRYRFRLPSPTRFEQTVQYRLPTEGEWTVVNGDPTREHSHSWGVLTQRYAYDLVVTDEEGRTYQGSGETPEDYYCYGEPLVAPADGVVVAANDGHRDYHRTGGWLDPRQRDIRGNFVTIEHADGEYSVLAHLQQNSVRVSGGDRVERGDPIGRCGNSGNSTEPHLHFHAQDHPQFYLGMGLPIGFDGVRTDGDGNRSGKSTTGETATDATVEQGHHDRTYLRAGQRVTPREE